MTETIVYQPTYERPTLSSGPLKSLPIDLDVELPSIPRPQWSHTTSMFMAPSLQEWSTEQETVWSIAKTVVQEKKNKVVLVVGNAGAGKQKLITALSRKLAYAGLMDRYRLLHTPSPLSSGHIIPVREILSPVGEDVIEFTQRWGEHMVSLFGDAPDLAQKKAAALASWCGLQEANIVDAHLGLMFFLRYIQAKSDLPAACLLASESHLTTLPGGGLSLCDVLLSDSFGPRPVLLMCVWIKRL